MREAVAHIMMHEVKRTQRRRERVAVVTVVTSQLMREYGGADDRLATRREELNRLVNTAGGTIEVEFTQTKDTPDPATFVGSGKAEQIAEAVDSMDLDLVVFNHELSPSQQTNLEEVIDARIVDRTRLILDIFAQRAQSREGKLQVELAQLTYLLPRLTGMGEELSRLAGGIGTRGPGESKLETDRRRVRRRMTDVRREIESVRQHRHLQRERRLSQSIPIFALVGYTNAGKSTLLNRMTGADQLVEDQLFATLDPATRKFELPRSMEACLVDTVGFVRDLPEQLRAAFRATLEEVVEAQFLIHVVDVSHPDWVDQARTVTSMLEEMDVLDKETITALNKLDRIDAPVDPAAVRQLPRPVLLSAATGEGLDDLREEMASLAEQVRVHRTYDIPYSKMEIVDDLHKHAEIHREEYREEGVHLEVTLDEVQAKKTNAKLESSPDV